MARTWKALPLPSDPRLLVKAPTWDAYQDQEYDAEHFRLPRVPAGQTAIAAALMDSVEDIRELGVGEVFTLKRYPTGLSVETPSGWVVMLPFEIPKDKGEKPTPKLVASNPVPSPEKRRKKGDEAAVKASKAARAARG